MTTCQPCNEVNRRPTYFDGIHFEFLALTTFSPSSTRRTASTPANYLVRNSTLVHSHFANSIFLPCRPSERARARARTREKNTSQRWKARRNEEVNGVTQCRRTILADKSFFESTHGRIDPPSPSLLDSSKRRAHSGMESLSTVTHGVARFFLFVAQFGCRRNVACLYCLRCNEK